ncbi:hypothetical protein ABG768_018963, partial [Culter alburnus]
MNCKLIESEEETSDDEDLPSGNKDVPSGDDKCQELTSGRDTVMEEEKVSTTSRTLVRKGAQRNSKSSQQDPTPQTS